MCPKYGTNRHNFSLIKKIKVQSAVYQQKTLGEKIPFYVFWLNQFEERDVLELRSTLNRWHWSKFGGGGVGIT